jgi:hypothetical protein
MSFIYIVLTAEKQVPHFGLFILSGMLYEKKQIWIEINE